ncbi:MAG TPA: UDP-N-acetylglucosamine 2-epimerase (non-hydrolyzing) [Methanomicrobiales archaeon]|nr:UDP-N-acetylglucosamine 2-epimerase (non-hydrolyzing) [Methanomicrobiales archaeon]
MIAIVVGTRPEIIKMSPVIRECEHRGLDYYVIHTGQHYSYEMDQIFFQELELPHPKYQLNVGSGTHAEQTAGILAGSEGILVKDRPDIVLVQGDTNTVLGAALAASKLDIPVGHIEAGLRSQDRRMPEEINRVLTDHLSRYLFAPTEQAREHLLREGIEDSWISVTGNSIVDAVWQNIRIAEKHREVLETHDLERKKFFLVTAHRQENVDDPVQLQRILEGISLVQEEFFLPVIFPAHPRTRKRIQDYCPDTSGVEIIDPVGFLEFLQLESSARLVLTDSGGVQEETCILGVPCVTLRENTERPETIAVGSNRLAGTDPRRILGSARAMLSQRKIWYNPFGDGRASERILDLCLGDGHAHRSASLASVE